MSENVAPIGASVSESTPVEAVDQQTGSNTETTDSTGVNPVDLTDDTPVRWVGEKEPIRYGDLAKRLQAAETRKNQAFSKQQREFARQQEEWKRQVAEERQRLETLASSILTQRANTGQPQDEFISTLQAQPYIDGKTAAKIVQELKEKGIGGVTQQIAERDRVIQYLANQLQTIQRDVQGLRGTYASQAFDGKIRNWVKQLDLPEEAVEFAKELYSAYEGEDLDDEFPGILERRWGQLQGMFTQQQRAKVEASRKRPFTLPGRGGNGVPSQNIGLTGRESPRDAADKLWALIQNADGDAT